MAREGLPPAFPIYADHELADEDLALAGHAAKGVYLDLRCYAWREGSIPSDPARLARLLRLTPAKFATIWTAIRDRFVPSDKPDRLVHPALEIERERMALHREQQSNRAKARWAAHAAAEPAQVPPESGGSAGTDAAPVQPPQSFSSASASTSAETNGNTHRAREESPLETRCRELVSVPQRAGAIGGDLVRLELARLVDRSAAACDPPEEPLDYAERAVRAYDAIRGSYRPGMQPAWRADALALHWDRVQRIAAGHETPPEPWQPEQRPQRAGAAPVRGRVPVAKNRMPPGAGGGGAT